MSLLATVKQANLPGPPEHSIVFRAAATMSVVVAIAACHAQGELSTTVAAVSIVLVVVGNVFSYRRRNRAFPFLKIILALAVVTAFVWFFATISGAASAGDIASVEGPLAVLFTVIQVTHAFDVPSRRDLAFSLAGSATLMAVAAAQAIDDTFATYVVLWAICGLVGLLAMWSSMAGGSRLRPRTAAVTAVAVVLLGLAVVVVLPAPHANSSLVLPSSLAADLSINQPAGLLGGGAKGNEPVHAAVPKGPTRVGGYLGFAGPLNTAIRGSLGTTVVFRVRADRPTYWVAETFNLWNGQSWTEAATPRHVRPWRAVVSGSPFLIPPSIGEVDQGALDYQTFYLNVAGPNLIFHAANASEVWFPTRRLYVSVYGTIRAGATMGRGSIYTVLSTVNTATPAQLAAAPMTSPFPGGTLPPAIRAQSTQLPHPYPRVEALATSIVRRAHATTRLSKIVALESWIGHHTRYTTDIPPLRPGQDTVTAFLFGNRRGYCEQISTSLTVMLRSLGIPAREATGYVPGPYNPITDLYEVQAKDAHAWVQVWFPGYGWQSFDPTADVPLANPTPGDVIAHAVGHALARLPWLPIAAGAAVVLAVALLVRWRRRAPATWAAAMTREIERASRRAGLGVRPGETLVSLAGRLDHRRRPPPVSAPPGPPAPTPWDPGVAAGAEGPPPAAPDDGCDRTIDVDDAAVTWARAAERAAFGGRQPDPATRRALLARARRLRRQAHRLQRREGRRPAPTDGLSRPTGAPGPPPSSPRQPAGAGRP